MGLLNGIIAAGAIVGAIAPSLSGQRTWYGALPAMAAASLAAALVVALPVLRSRVSSDNAPVS